MEVFNDIHKNLVGFSHAPSAQDNVRHPGAPPEISQMNLITGPDRPMNYLIDRPQSLHSVVPLYIELKFYELCAQSTFY